MKARSFLGWVMMLALLGGLGGPGCGTEPVAVEGCRKIEEIRCELAPNCSNLKISDVGNCKRFYRDQCLHGLAISSDPGAPVIDRCVEALKIAGACASTENGCVATTSQVSSGCQVIERPELAVDCAFLLPPASAPPSGVTLVGGSGGASGAGGDTSGGTGGAGM